MDVPYWDDLSAVLIFKNDSSKAGFFTGFRTVGKDGFARGFCDWKFTSLVLNFLFIILLSVNCKSDQFMSCSGMKFVVILNWFS